MSFSEFFRDLLNADSGPMLPESSRAVINASAQDERNSCYAQYGGNPVFVKDEETGADDLIYDPRDPEQMQPFGCLLNAAKARNIQIPEEVQEWHPDLLGSAVGLASDLPECVLLGPKELAGGMGLGICGDSCNQSNLGSCVGACGTNVTEDTIRSEAILHGQDQYLPEISIRYMYWFCQGRYSRPGGDGAMTSGLVATLMTYNQGWVCSRYPELMVNGRCGGVVHEKPFEGSKDFPVEIANGMPYDISACRAGTPFSKAWVELGVTHRAGYGGGDIRRVRDPQSFKQVIASGHVCFTGAGWPGAWGNVDRNGFCTSGWRGGGGGHEFEFNGYISRKAQSGYGGSNTHTRNMADGEDDWACLKNSWGLNFGLRGHAIVPMSQMQRAGCFNELMTLSFVDGWDKTILLDMGARFRVN